ncbi:hypothetical protein FNV43_RR04350 [Rhamnella rubrinervis]|uniref:Uncharacterized protein n=1 Tax=Rhamnella rubrinervis TaxID=2594499 RepID=A0A8K0HKJ3_9ROSA|nr:hypothetical protein FNV43_RR04350 [Rhamnella rubrinervis]
MCMTPLFLIIISSNITLSFSLFKTQYPSHSLLLSFCKFKKKKSYVGSKYMVKKSSTTMLGDSVLFMAMLVVQVCFAVINITSKLALESGVNPLIFVYRQENQAQDYTAYSVPDIFVFYDGARVSEKFPASYTSTALMCFMASIECGAIGLLVEHNTSMWSLQNPIWLVVFLFAVRFAY